VRGISAPFTISENAALCKE